MTGIELSNMLSLKRLFMQWHHFMNNNKEILPPLEVVCGEGVMVGAPNELLVMRHIFHIDGKPKGEIIDITCLIE